jgi:hypothetical protein
MSEDGSVEAGSTRVMPDPEGVLMRIKLLMLFPGGLGIQINEAAFLTAEDGKMRSGIQRFITTNIKKPGVIRTADVARQSACLAHVKPTSPMDRPVHALVSILYL